jgi:hypothetical protein
MAPARTHPRARRSVRLLQHVAAATGIVAEGQRGRTGSLGARRRVGRLRENQTERRSTLCFSGFRTTTVNTGPFHFGHPEDYARGKASEFPGEGGPVILIVDVPDIIVRAASDLNSDQLTVRAAMPIHDWTRVSAGTFHHFHHSWIDAIAEALNAGLLPGEYYAMAEQFAAGFGRDVLTLHAPEGENGAGVGEPQRAAESREGGVALARVDLQPTAETDLAFYRRKQDVVAVRDASGDRVVAVVEIVSRGNKSARDPLDAFVNKTTTLLERGVHLLIIDLYPPGPRDVAGIHNEIWQAIAGEEYVPPRDKPLALAAYESGDALRAYVVNAAVGDTLAEMPLFLQPGRAIMVPLEKSYQSAFARVPWRRRSALEDVN